MVQLGKAFVFLPPELEFLSITCNIQTSFSYKVTTGDKHSSGICLMDQLPFLNLLKSSSFNESQFQSIINNFLMNFTRFFKLIV